MFEGMYLCQANLVDSQVGHALAYFAFFEIRFQYESSTPGYKTSNSFVEVTLDQRCRRKNKLIRNQQCNFPPETEANLDDEDS